MPSSDAHKSFDLRLFNDGAPLVRFFKNEFECGRKIPLCILDMCMIRMSGLETAKALRAIDPEVFIIIITSYEGVSHKDLINALKREVYFLNKPIQKEEFLALVTSLLISWNNQQALHLAYQKLNLAHEKIKENEAYLKAIMSAIQTSVMIIDPENFKITDVNPYTLKMLHCKKEDLIGRDLYEFRTGDQSVCDLNSRVVSNEYALRTRKNDIIHVRRSVKKTRVKKKTYLVQSLLDITDIRRFMKKQEISIELAKYLLRMINRIPLRYTALANGLNLFFDAIYLPCFKEGGDHYFVRTMQGGKRRTLISLKDQSGHDVGCILRSIITDLTHHAILNNHPDIPLEEVITILNHKMYHSEVFNLQDFFTSADVAIDHETLDMSYVSAGHPRFFLIRGNDISGLPEHGSAGRNLPIPVLPDMRYCAGTCRLQTGDKLIFYSDGLNDLFGMKKNGSFTYHALKSSVQEIIDQYPAISVSELMHILSEKANLLSVSPNTLPDDISILGVEIEDDAAQHEIILKPATLADFNKSIFEIHLRLFTELKQQEFDISDLGLRSVLAESIINAWVHGNRRNPDKSIIIRWRHGNDFHLAIHDEGEGFDYQQTSDPKSGENITRESGRGIYIIRRFSDAVRWENGGRTVVIIIKKRHNAAEQTEQRRTQTLIRLW
jgi:PAS domain S-box-containing protein